MIYKGTITDTNPYLGHLNECQSSKDNMIRGRKKFTLLMIKFEILRNVFRIIR